MRALQTLLHTGMSELLRTATDASLPEPWPRVHAFNVLRLAFNDKNLATDSSGFFAEGAACHPCAILTLRLLRSYLRPTAASSIGTSKKWQRVPACC
jgi:hypothetical protein